MKPFYSILLLSFFPLLLAAQEAASAPANELGIRVDALRLNTQNEAALGTYQILYRRNLSGQHFLRFRGLIARGNRSEQNNILTNSFRLGGFVGYEYRKILTEGLSLVVGAEAGHVSARIRRRPLVPMSFPPMPNDDNRVNDLHLGVILGLHYSINELFFLQVEVLPNLIITNNIRQGILTSRNINFGMPENLAISAGLRF